MLRFVWSWLKEKAETRQKVRPVAPPSFEPLEPRLFLSGDIVGDDSALAPYGSLLGLAEQVDAGNRNLSDDALVFSHRDQPESEQPLSSVAVVLWDGGGDATSWHDPLNWDGDVLPGVADDVIIDTAANPIVQFAAAADAVQVNSLVAREKMTFSGGTLTVTGVADLGAAITVSAGGTVTAGTLQISGGTLTLNTGGVLSASQVEVLANATLTLNAAATFGGMHVASGGMVTHAVGNDGFNLTVTGDLAVDTGGAINVSGRGYGDRSGPGAGAQALNGGGGAYGAEGGDGNGGGGHAYGSLAMPVDLGSGGGRGWYTSQMRTPGGSGGGLVSLHVGGILTLNGDIRADGNKGGGGHVYLAYWSGGGGSGGSIWLSVGELAGSGTVSAIGGNGGWTNRAGGGSGGRIALYYDTNTFAGTMSAQGGAGAQYGGAGTIYTESSTQTHGNLLMDNVTHSGADTPLIESSYTLDRIEVRNAARLNVPATTALHIALDTLTVQDGGELLLYGQLVADGGDGDGTFNRVEVKSGGRLTAHSGGQLTAETVEVSNTGSIVLNDGSGVACGQVNVLDAGTLELNGAATFGAMRIASGGLLTHSSGQDGFDLTITRDLTVEAGGAINADGKGYGPASGPGAGQSVSVSQSSAYAGGAGHGGAGGSASAAGGGTYGDLTRPGELGSGGGNATWWSGTPQGGYPTEYGGRGGGKLSLAVQGRLTVDGRITAGGLDGDSAGAYWGGH